MHDPRPSQLFLLALAVTAGGATKPSRLGQYQAAERAVAKHIAVFDDLDFNVFSNQQWDRLHESHAQDIRVHWPDGHTTEGIERHIADLKTMFVYAPDTRIKIHPIKFGAGDWTSARGTGRA